MKVNIDHAVTVTATLKLDEVEIRALDAIVGYGVESFLRVFKEQLGKGYIRGYEGGVVSLFKAVDECCKPAIAQVDKARRLLKESVKAPTDD